MLKCVQKLIFKIVISIKTQKEIESLIEGGRRHKIILDKLRSLVAPGVSTLLFEEETQKMLKEFGDKSSFFGYTPHGAKRAYPASVCVSINDEIVHGIPNENPRKLKEGDIVSLDLGLVHNGMFVDGAITVPVGEVSKEVKRLMQATKESLEAGIKACKVGNTIGHIGEAIEKVSEKYQFSIVDDLCGHGVGHAVHEDPYVPNFGNAGEGPILKEGMVIAIEPMLSLGGPEIKIESDGYTYKTKDGSLSAHEEHTIVITDKGPIVVTR
jgi:methionyl aminopeptidase